MQCNNMQYHASLITADGAYHCPVGSIIKAIFFLASSFSKSNIPLLYPVCHCKIPTSRGPFPGKRGPIPSLECFLALLEQWVCLCLVSEAERRRLTRKRRNKIVFLFLICLTVTIDRRFRRRPVYELEPSERKHCTTITLHIISCDRVILGHFIEIFFAILQSKVINLCINIFRIYFLGEFLRLKSRTDSGEF